jgi:hypothetical protein
VNIVKGFEPENYKIAYKQKKKKKKKKKKEVTLKQLLITFKGVGKKNAMTNLDTNITRKLPKKIIKITIYLIDTRK